MNDPHRMDYSKSDKTLRALVDRFARDLPGLRRSNENEATIRHQYIDPFWRALGWRVGDDDRPASHRDVVVEHAMGEVIGLRVHSRRPDYLFRIEGFPRFVVEAKTPNADLSREEHIFQAKRYAWMAQIPFAILTNFARFRLFDCTMKPVIDQPERGLVRDYDLEFSDYVGQVDALLGLFGRRAVGDGSLDRLLAKIKGIQAGRKLRGPDRSLSDVRGTEPVDKEFLSFLEQYRRRFAEAIYVRNKSQFPNPSTLQGSARLTEAVQRLLDRLVFVRVCEDRDIATWGQLLKLLESSIRHHTDFYEDLTTQFRRYDREYNGYLFKPHFSEQVKIPQDLLVEFVTSLYPSSSGGLWDFSYFSDDILGTVYERFLGNVVVVKSDRVEVEERAEVRQSGGVVYTPRYIADAIVSRTIGPKVKAFPPQGVLSLKILDPACGSGSILVAAYQFLIDHCERVINADPELAKLPTTAKSKKTRPIAFRHEGRWHLAPDFKAELLKSCIHGVDLDAQAVEVTIMSLYLKMLEGPMPSGWQKNWLDDRLLPGIDNNIRCGNSLIDRDDFERWWEDTNGTLFEGDDDTKFRLNTFDWYSDTRGFGRVIGGREESRGFDCIIGNPPYIRRQNLASFAPEEADFYRDHYKSAHYGNYDIYIPFIEKGLELLDRDGLMGFIVPHKFWKAAYGKGLRSQIAKGKNLRKILDFGHQQVFRNVTTYTAIHVFGKSKPPEVVDYSAIDDLEDGPSQCRNLEAGVLQPSTRQFKVSHPASSEHWRFTAIGGDPPALGNDKPMVELGQITSRLFQGIRTSKNEVFVLEVVDRHRGLYRSIELGVVIELEADLLRPFLEASDMRRYEIRANAKVVIFPYKPSSARSGVDLIPLAQLEKYPRTMAYLRRCEATLRARERGKLDTDRWYGFGRTQNLNLFDVPRILVPDMIESGAFSIDARGEYAFVSGYGIILKSEYCSYDYYLLGLLNTQLLTNILRELSTPMRGGWFRTFPQYMEKLPIWLPNSPEQLRVCYNIGASAKELSEAIGKLRNPHLSDRERGNLESDVEALESRIETTVVNLYAAK